jgi:hypothetical protein
MLHAIIYIEFTKIKTIIKQFENKNVVGIHNNGGDVFMEILHPGVILDPFLGGGVKDKGLKSIFVYVYF